MDLKIVQRLIQMMDKGGVHELELEDAKDGLKLRLKRGAEVVQQTAPVLQLMHSGGPGPMPVAQPGTMPVQGGAPGTQGAHAPAPAPQGTPITSPMVGTFYRSPNPDSEPFVGVGSRVSLDQTICIIEAMKVMNEIRSEVAGEILQVLVENGEPVEFGQPLFLVKPL